MTRWYPPTGRRGHNRGPVINQFIEEKMERASQAKRVELRVNGHSLDVRYIEEDPETGQRTLIQEHLTTGDPEELERIRQKLEETYLAEHDSPSMEP